MLIGESAPFVRAVALLDRFARCDAPVLIEGETGTGKELAARRIHYGGDRRAGPFVPINCGAIPDSLFENELFGHGRGAFTDARADAFGCVRLAQGGTLFLDEVDGLSPRGQVALLRFLQDHTYRPLGGGAECRANVRVVAAANASLDALVARGAFRRDLLFRVKLLYVEMPPLRSRAGDVRLLAEQFLRDCAVRYGIAPRTLEPEAASWLEAQDWPGNVRELENLIHRACLLGDGPGVTLADVAQRPPEPAPPGAPVAYRAARAQAIESFHRQFLMGLLRAARGNLSSAARSCGIDRRLLGRLAKRYAIDPALFRS